MKKNGMTMIEVMISVALISIVMVFIFNILIDLRQEETLSGYKSSDQINRSVITKTIQDDLLNRRIINIAKSGVCSSLICLDLYYRDGTVGHIKVEDTYFYYGIGSDIEKWELKTGKYSSDFAYCYLEKGENFYMQLLFPVDLSSTALESKMLFDVELLFMSKKTSDLRIPLDGSSLGARRSCDSLT